MRSPGCRRCSIRVRGSVVLLCALCGIPVSPAQQQGGTPQNLELKDPTPREPDLKKIYSTDPAEQAKLQQAAALKSAQVRQQVVEATNKLCLLVQQLHDEVSSNGKDPRTSGNAAMAGQIEKLAKTVREKTKTQ